MMYVYIGLSVKYKIDGKRITVYTDNPNRLRSKIMAAGGVIALGGIIYKVLAGIVANRASIEFFFK